MDNAKEKILKEKYINGQTSLEEEKELFLSNNLESGELKTWVQYVNLKKRNAPEHLNEDLWKKSAIHKKNYVRIFAGLTSVAACILIIMNIPLITKKKDADYEAKKLLLEQAMAMIESSEPSTESKEIFYKDDLVTIYLSYD